MTCSIKNLAFLFWLLAGMGAWSLPCDGAKPYVPVLADPILRPERRQSFPELNDTWVRCSVEDSSGAMWFGTSDGVWRYDGMNWTVYTQEHGLSGNLVHALCATQNGDIYAGTDLGISRLRDGSWAQIFPSQGEMPWPVYDLQESSDGHVWAGSFLGILEWDHTDVVLHAPEEMAQVLQRGLPWLQTSAIPNEVAPQRSWQLGIGVVLTDKSLLAVHPGRVPREVWAVFPNSPADTAGLKVGDRIMTADVRDSIAILTVQQDSAAESKSMQIKQATGFARDFNIWDVYEDREGALWFGLFHGEFVRRDAQGNWALFDESDGLAVSPLPRIIQKQDGVFWAVSASGHGAINQFDNQTWTHFELDIWASPRLPLNNSIIETRDGALWISVYRGLLMQNDGQWKAYTRNKLPFSSSRIVSFVEASDGALWVVQENNGVFRLERNDDRWLSYRGLQFKCETSDGIKWFLGANGCVRFDSLAQVAQQRWIWYGVEDGLMEEVRDIYATRDGEIWATGQHAGVSATARFLPSVQSDLALDDGASGKVWQLETHPRFAPLIYSDGIIESDDGTIWFGGMSADMGEQFGGGMLRYRKEENDWLHYTSLESPTPTSVRGIAQTPDGDIWVGGGSLHRFDGQTWSAVVAPGVFARVWQYEVYCDALGELWVGTAGQGVMRRHAGAENTWTRYTVKDGLPDGVVHKIYRTQDGSVWASTDKGFSRFDGQTWTPYVLQGKLPAGEMVGQSSDGAIWFNAGGGATRYTPDPSPPETEILTVPQSVSETGQATVTWKGADMWRTTPTEALRYAWRLDGGEWSAFSSETVKFFSDLSHGRHTFEVKARDLDFNEDPTPAVVAFVVNLPVWRRPWFLALMSLLGGVIGVQTVRVIRRDMRLQEQSERKSAFLSSMSHELRTPLTSIKGYADNMLDGIGGVLNERHARAVNRMKTNVDVLLSLVNDILDLAKIEAGRMDVMPETFQVQAFVQQCCDTVRPMVKPEVHLKWDVAEDVADVYTDPGKLRQILVNLLSNALKFTDQGDVIVSAKKEREGEWLTIAVSDQGVGIPEDALDKVFDEYQQVKGSNKYGKGTGLGLPITKKLAELLGGVIEVTSTVGEGTTFTVRVLASYAPWDAD